MAARLVVGIYSLGTIHDEWETNRTRSREMENQHLNCSIMRRDKGDQQVCLAYGHLWSMTCPSAGKSLSTLIRKEYDVFSRRRYISYHSIEYSHKWRYIYKWDRPSGESYQTMYTRGSARLFHRKASADYRSGTRTAIRSLLVQIFKSLEFQTL